MQALTDELRAILLSRLQAGADGCYSTVSILGPSVPFDFAAGATGLWSGGTNVDDENEGSTGFGSGGEPALALDGNDATCTSAYSFASPGATADTFTVDLGAARTIDSVRVLIEHHNVAPSTITVEYSTDNATWHEAAAAHTMATWDETWDVASTSAQYWRIVTDSWAMWHQWTLNTLSLFGGAGGTLIPVTGISRISIDKSLQTDADAFDVECQLSGDVDWAGWIDHAIPDAEIVISQWFGDPANAVQTFAGYLDKPDQVRDPSARTITLSGRDYMKKAIVQGAIVTAPQGADEAGAVRTAANFVFLNAEVSTIVSDLVGDLDFPSTTVQPTSYLVTEYAAADNDSYAKMLSDMGGLVAYRSYCDELGEYHFEPRTQNVDYDEDTGAVTPDWTFTSGVDLTSLEHAQDDFELLTRIKVTGPMSTLQDSWTQTWVMTSIPYPTGTWYDPADPTHIKVLSGSTKKLYTVLQSTRAITAVSAAIPSTYYPCGLSGDPADSTIYWVLDAPWKAGYGATACTIIKRRKSDNATLATYNIGTNHWADIKADGSNLWLANITDGKFHKRSKADGSAVSNYSVAGRSDPSGLAIDGTTGYLFFAGIARMYRVALADPTTILQTISTSGTGIIGGDIDTTTHAALYACADTVRRVWKYAMKTAVSNAVSVTCIAGVGVVDPEPTVPTGPVELALNNPIRRQIMQVPVITSLAQAAETAMGQLALVDHVRHVMTAGIIANPAIQKGDIVQVNDAVTGESALWVVDTYRTEMSAGTYLGVLGLTAWPF